MGDPIARLKQHLIVLGEWDEDRHAAMDKALAETVRDEGRKAEALGTLHDGLSQPFTTMFEDVFEEQPWHLKEQSEQMQAERKAAGI